MTNNNYPLYSASSDNNNEIVLENISEGTKYNIQIVVKPNYILDKWTRSTNNGTLTSDNLLNTEYTYHGDEILEARGKPGNYSYMQELTINECQDNGTNVTDKRDGRSYAVSKLRDGKCYMTQNLRLEDMSLTPENTDINSTYYLSGTHISKTGGNYNSSLASANSSLSSGVNGIAQFSICPKGWKLPAYEDFDSLKNRYNYASRDMLAMPANFIYGSHGDDDLLGMYWWTSQIVGNQGALYCFATYSSGQTDFWFGSNNSPHMSIRCILR